MTIKRTTLLRLLMIMGLLTAVIAISITYPKLLLSHLDKLKMLAEQHIIIAALLFISLYVLATVLIFLPVSFLTLMGGWLFGPILGAICNVLGALIGATLAFLVSRHFAADWVAHHIGERLKTVRDGVSQAGWRFVALVRLAHILPFNILNCALGLTELTFWEYLLATALFMLPTKLAYTYVGSLGFTFIVNPQQSNLIKIVLVCGIIIAAAIVPWLIKYFRQRNRNHQL